MGGCKAPCDRTDNILNGRGMMTAGRRRLRQRAGVMLGALTLMAVPAVAQANSAAADYFMGRNARSAVPGTPIIPAPSMLSSANPPMVVTPFTGCD